MKSQLLFCLYGLGYNECGCSSAKPSDHNSDTALCWRLLPNYVHHRDRHVLHVRWNSFPCLHHPSHLSIPCGMFTFFLVVVAPVLRNNGRYSCTRLLQILAQGAIHLVVLCICSHDLKSFWSSFILIAVLKL